ncbi:MAG: T9SS type A sorting domain-containing protein [Bacteroidetes bacterium]|nr:T9SS type A sorting domain-containing protein [Bacteroidota bacterium]
MKSKPFYIFVLLALLWGSAQAQDYRPISREAMSQKVSLNRWYMNQLLIESGGFVGPQDRVTLPASSEATPDAVSELDKTSAISVQKIAEATNAYTILRQQQNQLIADNGLNLVSFIHRQSLDQVAPGPAPPTTSNGISRLAVSTNRGTSWTQNLGPLNPVPYPNTARGRYPQVALYRPGGSTNIADAQFAWVSPCTDGSNWGNYMWGNATKVTTDLNGGPHGSDFVSPSAKFSFLGNSQDNPVLLPGGLCMGKPGEFWLYDVAYASQATLDSTLLFRGVYNETSEEVEWELHRSFKPPYRKSTTNGRPLWASGPTVDFSPDGMTGWTCIAGAANTPGHPNDVAINPILYKTIDGGTTWTGPYIVYINDYEAITDSLHRFYRGTGSSGQDTIFSSSGVGLAFNYDLRVDANGNPHIFMEVVNAADESYINGGKVGAGSITYTFQPGLYKGAFDITSCDGGRTWEPKHITELVKYSGTIPGSALNIDTRLKLSRSEDGNVMFYSWSDDTLRTRENNQMQPSLWHRAIRVSDEARSPIVQTPMSGVNASFNNRVFYPTTSPTVLDQGGVYTIPTVFMQLPFNNDNLRADFYYINGREVNASSLVVPTRDMSIVSINAPASNVCSVGNQDVTIEVRNNGTVAVDSFSVTYFVEGNQNATWRRVEITPGSPLAPGNTQTVTFNASNGVNLSNVVGGQVNFASTGTYNIIARVSTYNDHVVCNNLAHKRVVVNGGDGAIFASNEAEDCGTITLNTGLEENDGETLAADWFVEEGAGNFVSVSTSSIASEITVDGQSLHYAPPVSTSAINQRFRVEVTSSACGTASDEIDVTINPVPTVTLQVKEGIGNFTNINDGALDNVTLVGGKYQVCGAGNNRLYVQLADTVTNPQYQVRWYRGDEIIAANLFSSSNFQRFSEPGAYTAELKDNVTGCTSVQTYNFRIWNISLDLSSISTNVCLHRTNLINASNASTGTFGDVIYDWTVTPVAHPNYPTEYPGDDTTYVRRNRNSTFGLLWPNETENINLDTRTATYTVRAWDADSLCSNSTNAVSASRTITAWDSTGISVTSDLPLDSRLCVYERLTVNNTSTAAQTPITHKWWAIAPSNRLELVSGSLGSLTTPGSDQIVVRTRDNSVNLSGNRSVTLITCSAPPTAVASPTTNPNYILNVGCCDTLRLTWAAQLPSATCIPNSRGSKTDLSSQVDVFPNPTSGVFEVVTGFDRQTQVRLELMDARGILIERREMTAIGEFEYKLDLSNHASGIYLMRMITPEGVAIKRIVKQ